MFIGIGILLIKLTAFNNRKLDFAVTNCTMKNTNLT